MEQSNLLFIPYLLATAAFAAILYGGYTKRLPANVPNRGLLIAIALAYLVPALLTSDRGNPDIDNFQYTAQLVRGNSFVYTAPRPDPFFSFHPYFPFQMFIAAAADWLDETIGVPFSVALKIPSIAAVMATAVLLRVAVSRIWNARTGTVVSLAYGLNPVVFGITAYHGQFDAIPAFLAFAAWFKLRFARSSRDELISASLLGLAVLSKTWPLILLPAFAIALKSGMMPRLRYLAIVVALPALVSLAYALALGGSAEEIVREVSNYQGIRGFFGYTLVLAHLPGSEQQIDARLDWVAAHGRAVLLSALAVVAAITLVKRRAASAASVTLLLTFYVFAPTSVHHHQLWVLPFAAVAGQRTMLAMFTALVTLDIWWHPLYSQDWGLPSVSLDRAWAVGGAVWVFTALWLISSLTGLKLKRYMPAKIQTAIPRIKLPGSS